MKKKNNLKSNTKKLAVSAVLSALSIVVMLIGSVTGFLDLTMVAIASIFVFFAILEMGSPYQYLIYVTTSLLSMLLLPDKFSAILYMAFGGIYPMLKQQIEKLPRLFSWIPMAARISEDVGREYDPNNHLLMHAMGPNVAGVIGSAIAAGFLLAIV